MVDTVTLLDRVPDRVRRFAYRVASGKGALGRLADAVRYRFSEYEVPDLPPLSVEERRFLIGPANSAGQGYLWSRAAEQYLPATTAIAMQGIRPGPFRPNTDLRVPVAVYQRSTTWHAAFENFLEHQTHVIWESGLPLLGRRFESDVSRELRHLKDRGVSGGLLFHGSDIRVPSLHAAESLWSPFRNQSGPLRALEETAEKNVALAARSQVPVFVSTPDLLRWLPDAIWLPVVVDASRWRVPAKNLSAHPPVVAHAPSQRWLKGTDSIEPMLRRLSEEGVIDYRQAVGMPHSSMPEFYADADIVLDQFLIGSYGVTACEAMAAGTVVMGHVDDSTRAKVREATGMDLPVHEATIASLETELRRVARQPDSFEEIRVAGPAFVARAHDGRLSAAALARFMGISA